jgi:VIT1/CCC1 family predicted Fe2+/Mn2+ transporter
MKADIKRYRENLRDELNGSELYAALAAAATSFALFSAGAIFPVLPFLWMKGHWVIGASIVASGAVLCAVGMLTSLFNGRSPWYSAARQMIFGCLAAGVTYGIGVALGTTLS